MYPCITICNLLKCEIRGCTSIYRPFSINPIRSLVFFVGSGSTTAAGSPATAEQPGILESDAQCGHRSCTPATTTGCRRNAGSGNHFLIIKVIKGSLQEIHRSNCLKILRLVTEVKPNFYQGKVVFLLLNVINFVPKTDA